MSSKHTPTPWDIAPRLHAEMHCAVMGADGHLVVNVGDGGKGIGEQNANARHIVHCVNTHPQMLEALKAQHVAIDTLFAMLITITGRRGDAPTAEIFYPSKSGQPWEACRMGNEAIELAEGQ